MMWNQKWSMQRLHSLKISQPIRKVGIILVTIREIHVWKNKSLHRSSGRATIYYILVFNWNNFEMRFLNLRINFYLSRTFCPHLGSFCVVSSFTTFRPNFTSGLLQVILPRPRIGMLSLVTVSPVITEGARDAADRGIESLRFQVSIVRR